MYTVQEIIDIFRDQNISLQVNGLVDDGKPFGKNLHLDLNQEEKDKILEEIEESPESEPTSISQPKILNTLKCFYCLNSDSEEYANSTRLRAHLDGDEHAKIEKKMLKCPICKKNQNLSLSSFQNHLMQSNCKDKVNKLMKKYNDQHRILEGWPEGISKKKWIKVLFFQYVKVWRQYLDELDEDTSGAQIAVENKRRVAVKSRTSLEKECEKLPIIN